jgi:prophage DNA circulation protein
LATFAEVLFGSSFEGIDFPVTNVDVAWGHDNVKHKGLRTDGVDVEPTGLKPFTFKYTIALFNDLDGEGSWSKNLFPEVYQDLVNALRDNPIGQLNDIARGEITVAVDDVQEHWVGEKQDGLYLDVTFTQHNGSATLTGLQGTSSEETSNPSQSVETRAVEADGYRSGGFANVPPLSSLATTLTVTAETSGAGFRDVDAAVSALVNTAQSNLGLTVTQGVEAHDYRVAVTRTIAAAYAVKTAVLGIVKPRTYIVPVTMPLTRIAAQQQVYGDPSKANLLSAANSIPDPVRVLAGTVLSVPPVT